MTEELQDKIVNTLFKAGIDPQSNGHAYLIEAITLMSKSREINKRELN